MDNKHRKNTLKTLKKPKKTKTIKRDIIIVDTFSSTNSLNESLNNDKNIIENILPENSVEKRDLKIPQNNTIMTTSNIPKGRLNEQFIELMEKLSDIMMKQGEPFRARAYQKAQETIMAIPVDILSPQDLKGKPGIGDTIMEKLNEYVSTGTLKVLEREKNNPINIISEVYGIGPKKAKELVDKNITTIEELREKQDELLNDTQKVGLKYYEDILQRIPRSEIDQYAHIFKKAFDKINIPGSDSAFEIVGSYRRGAVSSGDIDVIITSDSLKVFPDFIDILIKERIILEVLSRGPSKCLVIAKIPSSSYARRVDFLYTSKDEYPFSVLYFTGSKIFNTVMRHQALTMGLTMNEHGLYKMDGKKKGERVDHHFKNEKDIFDYLRMEYKEPNERIDGRAVVIKKTLPAQNETIIIPEKNEIIVAKASPIKKTLRKKDTDKTNTKTKKNIVIVDEEEVESPNEKINKIDYNPDPEDVRRINDFKKNGIGILNKLSEKQLVSMMTTANILYRNYQPIMTDNEFDILQDYITEKYPSNLSLQQIGAPVEKNKVDLPYQMASMDKIKPDTNALTNWTKKYKGPYVLSCKLDGVSGLYTTENNASKLYTRGDGKVGQDVSHLIPYLKLPKTKGVVIRGEFIIPKKVFETKYKDQFANPRNLVAGIINHKSLDEKVKDIHFVAYEVIKPVLTPSKQMEFLADLNVDRVLNRTVSNISNELLSEVLVEWRKDYIYEIDGIIVSDDKTYERKSGNPEHSFAFKMVLSDQIAEAKVVDVIWTPSKDGYLKPRVQIEPIQLGGVKIEYATGFNAAFIEENRIGVGAIIELIRSGDVIPHIRKVIVPAQEPKMPSVPYTWNSTHIDVMLENITGDETVHEKNITGFFRGIGVDGLSSGNIKRLIQAGFDSVPKIIAMTKEDFLKAEGFKDKLATKIYDGIREKLKEASIVSLMSASNIFGRGFSEKKLELIIDSYPDILLSEDSNEELVKKISSIKGMAQKSAEAFVDKIDDFTDFMEDAGLEDKLYEDLNTNKKEVDSSNPLFEKMVVITGFRDEKLHRDLKELGAKLGTSVSKNTFVVVVKDKEEETGKKLEAEKLGIPVLTLDEFNKKYM
jgi:NAD-dependent DNA ligase